MKIGEQYAPTKLQALNRFEKMVAYGQGLQQLRAHIKPLMHKIMPLAGSTLGFLTDKDTKGGYAAKEIVDVIAEACLRGLEPIHNEINIIAGKLYVTKAGLQRLLREFPGLSDLQCNIMPPQAGGKDIVLCQATAVWRLKGKPQALNGGRPVTIPIKTDAYTSVDAALGKAQRKLFARVYDQLIGSDITPLPEGEVGEPVELLDITPEEPDEEVAGDVGEVAAALDAANRQLAPPERVQEPTEDPRTPVEGPVPYQDDKPSPAAPELDLTPPDFEPPEPLVAREPMMRPAAEVFFAPEREGPAEGSAVGPATGSITTQGVRRIINAAQVTFGDAWGEKCKEYTNGKFGVTTIAKLPKGAEKEMLQWMAGEATGEE